MPRDQTIMYHLLPWLIGALLLLVGPSGSSPLASAQSARGRGGSAAAPATGNASAGEAPKKRSNHFRALTEIRAGSMLRRATEPPPPPDIRGEYERRRDHQVLVHFQRMAQLDAIAAIASNAGDASLVSRVEEVRRQELDRFRLAMAQLHRMAVGNPAGGSPR